MLEVSIDGARGVLFNVIGGNDMSMHEINAAAETITAAADPDANIIFGATINPDLDGEVIITVVATGFDASYFSDRDATPAKAEPTQNKLDENLMKDMDVSLEAREDDEKDSFKSEAPMPNIWTLDGDHDEDKESKDDKEVEKPSVTGDSIVDDEEELEKPSFLRRLKKLRGQSHDDDKKEESAEENDK